MLMRYLIPRHLTTQRELNEWEQFNIVHANSGFLDGKRRIYIH